MSENRMDRAIFRQATSADIPAMSGIRLSVTENVLSDPGRVTRTMYEDYLEVAGRGWVAEIDGVVVAFCYAARMDGSIWALFVRPGNEGRGLAKHLLGLAVDWIFALGHASARLDTGAHTRADRFYAMQGWERKPVGESKVEYTLPAKARGQCELDRTATAGRIRYAARRAARFEAAPHRIEHPAPTTLDGCRHEEGDVLP